MPRLSGEKQSFKQNVIIPLLRGNSNIKLSTIVKANLNLLKEYEKE